MFVFSFFRKYISIEIERFNSDYLFKIKSADVKLINSSIDILPNFCSLKVPVAKEDEYIPSIFQTEKSEVKGRKSQLAYDIVDKILNSKIQKIDNNDIYADIRGERAARIIIRKKIFIESHQSVLKRVEEALTLEMF